MSGRGLGARPLRRHAAASRPGRVAFHEIALDVGDVSHGSVISRYQSATPWDRGTRWRVNSAPPHGDVGLDHREDRVEVTSGPRLVEAPEAVAPGSLASA